MTKERKPQLSTIEDTLTATTSDVMKMCTDILLSYYPAKKGKPRVFVLRDEFVYAVGDGPIALVSHVDTVRDRFVPTPKGGAEAAKEKTWKRTYNGEEKPVELIRDRNVLMNANGVLGADDRAGVFACLELVRRCAKEGKPLPTVILTNGEESGGIGVGTFVSTDAFTKYDEGRTRLFVEMDRCNATEWVTYGSPLPKEVVSYVESFGFHKGNGSYSDIADLQEEYLIPAVNLSIGYYSQHTCNERLHLDEMYMTIYRVWAMLNDPIDKLYTVAPYTKSYQSYNYSGAYGGSSYWDKDKDKDKDTGGKGNAASGNGSADGTSSGAPSFPHGKLGVVTVNEVLDACTKGGFCKECGHKWNECECGEVLKELVTYLPPADLEKVILNYLTTGDTMHDLLHTYLVIQGFISIENAEGPSEDTSDPFHVGALDEIPQLPAPEAKEAGTETVTEEA